MATTKLPWLLYSYPWMPYPRQLAIYLCEKRIPSSMIRIVHVSDPAQGDNMIARQAQDIPPRHEGSLPNLAIPSSTSPLAYHYIHHSMTIITYLEEATSPPLVPSPRSQFAPCSKAPIPRLRALYRGLLSLAKELTASWNPIRIFGTKAGTISFPHGAKEMCRWTHRTLIAVNNLLAQIRPDGLASSFAEIADDGITVSIAEIVLFQFLEFTDACYGSDVTQGTGEVNKDVYERTRCEVYPVLKAWYQAFTKNNSAIRHESSGQEVPE